MLRGIEEFLITKGHACAGNKKDLELCTVFTVAAKSRNIT